MNAIKLQTTIDEKIAEAMPELRPLLGREVELIALEQGDGARGKKLSVDEFLAGRIERPAGVAPVSIHDIERAILAGAAGLE